MLQQTFQEETFHIGLPSSTHSTLHVFYTIQVSANLDVYLGPMAKHICWAETSLCLSQHSFEGALSWAVQPDTAIAHGGKVIIIASPNMCISWSHALLYSNWHACRNTQWPNKCMSWSHCCIKTAWHSCRNIQCFQQAFCGTGCPVRHETTCEVGRASRKLCALSAANQLPGGEVQCNCPYQSWGILSRSCTMDTLPLKPSQQGSGMLAYVGFVALHPSLKVEMGIVGTACHSRNSR